ncbi:NAD(P)/FAD-dependent oxidoreductase [Acetobacter sacchari]|nr:FAD-binding oxidoreductase [Acetobacter sacchari]
MTRQETGRRLQFAQQPLMPASLYVDTTQAPPVTERLSGETRVDVAVIGAGITGLSAALHIAASGRRVAVLDSAEPGWGASGRNGGQINPGLKALPSEVERDFGREVGRRLAVAAWNAPDLVFALIDRYSIQCSPARGGTIRAATGQAQLPGLERLTDECRARGGDVAWLNAAEMAALTGTSRYVAGMIDRRGGQINPLAYTRGLAAAAIGEGAAVYSNSRAVGLSRSGEAWRVRTPTGAIVAGHVVLAANGYTDGLWPELAESVIPLFSAIVATEPLRRTLAQTILAQREVLYELGDVTIYYRVDDTGRLLVGGRSASRPLSGPDAFPFLRELALRMWPNLDGVEWTHGWNGRLAMTRDHYPHWHEPTPGVIAALGYNGRGVAMATLLGREISRRIDGTPAHDVLLPTRPISPIPLHRFWPVGVAARVAFGQWKDSRAERGRA